MTEPRRASDDLLVQLIRENRHDAEIGVRMGITTGEVRERKTELRRRLGEDRYLRLIAGKPERGTPFWKRRWFMGAGALGCFGGLLLLMANVLVDDPEEIAAERTVLPPTPLPTTRPPAIVTAGEQRFDDAGVFFALASSNGLDFVGSPTNHASVAVMDLEATAYVVPSEFAHWKLADTGYREVLVGAELGGRKVTVRVTSAHAATRVRTVAEGVGPVARLVSQLEIYSPVVFVRAYDERGRVLTPRLTVDGRLQISQQPVPEDWILEATNGSRLETSESIHVAAVDLRPGVSAKTFCDDRDDEFRCLVILQRASGLTLVREGNVTCPTSTTRVVEFEDVRLSFARGFAINAADEPCAPYTVIPGVNFVTNGDWEITVETLAGEPLSLGVTNSGMLVAGRFAGDLSCPCVGD
jgi:hypothetical protein